MPLRLDSKSLKIPGIVESVLAEDLKGRLKQTTVPPRINANERESESTPSPREERAGRGPGRGGAQTLTHAPFSVTLTHQNPIMFSAQYLQQKMRAVPFQPFRIHMTDGKSHDISFNDECFITRSWVEVVSARDADGIPSEYPTRCAILHITRIEDLKPANPASSGAESN